MPNQSRIVNFGFRIRAKVCGTGPQSSINTLSNCPFLPPWFFVPLRGLRDPSCNLLDSYFSPVGNLRGSLREKLHSRVRSRASPTLSPAGRLRRHSSLPEPHRRGPQSACSGVAGVVEGRSQCRRRRGTRPLPLESGGLTGNAGLDQLLRNGGNRSEMQVQAVKPVIRGTVVPAMGAN